MIIEINSDSLPGMENPLQVLAWRNAYDHGFRTLTRRFKLESTIANRLAQEYAEKFWRDWLDDRSTAPPPIAPDHITEDQLSLA